MIKMAEQREVETVSVPEAANFLMVSEELMETLLNDGEVPFYQKGQERRIPFDLLSDYDRKVRQGQGDAINFISQEFKEMGLHEYFERT
jgi:excisionase family DNA binding protein